MRELARQVLKGAFRARESPICRAVMACAVIHRSSRQGLGLRGLKSSTFLQRQGSVASVRTPRPELGLRLADTQQKSC